MKLTGTLLIFAGIVVFGGIFSGEYFFDGYSIKNNTISDLGQRVDPINTSLKSSILFNGAMILSGLAMALAAVLLYTKLNNNWITITFFIHGLATCGVGLVNTTIKPAHLIIAIITFLTIEFTSIASYNLTNGYMKYLLAGCGVVSIIFLVGNLLFVKLMGVGIAERFIVYPTTIWLFVIGIFLLTKYDEVSNVLKK